MKHHEGGDHLVCRVLHGGGQVPDWVKEDDNPLDELPDSINPAIDVFNKEERVQVAIFLG